MFLFRLWSICSPRGLSNTRLLYILPSALPSNENYSGKRSLRPKCKHQCVTSRQNGESSTRFRRRLSRTGCFSSCGKVSRRFASWARDNSRKRDHSAPEKISPPTIAIAPCREKNAPVGSFFYMSDLSSRFAYERFPYTHPHKQIGRPQATADDILTVLLHHYPTYRNKQLNVSELARVCDLSRITVYKCIELLEKLESYNQPVIKCRKKRWSIWILC